MRGMSIICKHGFYSLLYVIDCQERLKHLAFNGHVGEFKKHNPVSLYLRRCNLSFLSFSSCSLLVALYWIVIHNSEYIIKSFSLCSPLLTRFELSFSFACSPFIMECLNEFYSTYDDTCLKCNGADLLTRVAKKFLSKENASDKQLELLVQPSFIFFPISPHNITRYFSKFFTSSVCFSCFLFS